MSDFKKWREEHSPDRKDVQVCFNRELLYQFEEIATNVATMRDEAKMVVAQAKGMLAPSDEVEAIQEKLATAEAELLEVSEKVRAAQRTIVFKSIGTRKWRDLLSEHPPEGNQRKVVTLTGLPLEFNPDTFVPAAIHACAIEPEVSIEDAEWFAAEMPVKEVDRVFGAVLTINVTGLDRPFDDTGSPLLGERK